MFSLFLTRRHILGTALLLGVIFTASIASSEDPLPNLLQKKVNQLKSAHHFLEQILNYVEATDDIDPEISKALLQWKFTAMLTFDIPDEKTFIQFTKGTSQDYQNAIKTRLHSSVMGGLEKYDVDSNHPEVKLLIEKQKELMKRVPAAEKKIASQ
jgi:hypothetical protein